MGVVYKAISGLRTFEEQDALYAQGRTKPGPKVTNVRGGGSYHNFGLAVDFGVFSKTGKYLDGAGGTQAKLAAKMHAKAGKIAKKYGIEWGGNWKRFKDYPHFQWNSGLSKTEMRRRLKEGKAIV